MRKVREENGNKITVIIPDEVKVGDKVMYDIGELYGIEQPNICHIPDWKIQLELEGKADFGILRELRKNEDKQRRVQQVSNGGEEELHD